MKKLLAGLAFMLTSGLLQAQTDSARGSKYDYYPETNIYYNNTTQTYWYRDSTANQWKRANQLPSGYSVKEKSRKNTFYYNGGDVWGKNADHIKMYGKKSNTKNP